MLVQVVVLRVSARVLVQELPALARVQVSEVLSAQLLQLPFRRNSGEDPVYRR